DESEIQVMTTLTARRFVLAGLAGLLALCLATHADAQRVKAKAVAVPAGPTPDAAPLLLAQVKEEPPSPRILQRLGTNQLRHGSRILTLAFSPQGQILVAGGGSD